MSFKNKKILVTGAGGFIGSHLVEELVAQGAQMKALVRYNSRNYWGMLNDLDIDIRNNIEVLLGNICDLTFVRKVVKDCDYVFHLAALIGIPYSYIAPHDYVAVNIQGTVNILQACLDERTPRLINTSTSETYGTAVYVPIDEKHPLQGQSPYSASKIAADKMVESFNKSFDLPVVTVRPFNTFGPRQSARAFIPTTICQAMTRENIIMGSLKPVRDLTYVKDTVSGFLHVALCDEVQGEVVNLGVGIGYSVDSVIKTILKIMDKENLPIQLDHARIRPTRSEVMRLISNNTKAREICGWEPKFSLEEGLIETINWIKSNIGLFMPNVYVC